MFCLHVRSTKLVSLASTHSFCGKKVSKFLGLSTGVPGLGTTRHNFTHNTYIVNIIFIGTNAFVPIAVQFQILINDLPGYTSKRKITLLFKQLSFISKNIISAIAKK